MGNHWTSKWRLQPVRRCCKGSQPGRVAPASRNNIMKITKTQLKQIIKEELKTILEAYDTGQGDKPTEKELEDRKKLCNDKEGHEWVMPKKGDYSTVPWGSCKKKKDK